MVLGDLVERHKQFYISGSKGCGCLQSIPQNLIDRRCIYNPDLCSYLLPKSKINEYCDNCGEDSSGSDSSGGSLGSGNELPYLCLF